eukprot:7107034-Pyramimonas_sp.AAC.2
MKRKRSTCELSKDHSSQCSQRSQYSLYSKVSQSVSQYSQYSMVSIVQSFSRYSHHVGTVSMAVRQSVSQLVRGGRYSQYSMASTVQSFSQYSQHVSAISKAVRRSVYRSVGGGQYSHSRLIRAAALPITTPLSPAGMCDARRTMRGPIGGVTGGYTRCGDQSERYGPRDGSRATRPRDRVRLPTDSACRKPCQIACQPF